MCKRLKLTEVLNGFKNVDTANYPDFDLCEKPLDMSLWALWVARDSLHIPSMNAYEIASVVIDVKEVSISEVSITNSLKRAGSAVHTHKVENITYYKIMKLGTERLQSLVHESDVIAFYFEPGKRFTNKRILVGDLFVKLNGDLSIVDPYCDSKTLDVLHYLGERKVRFLTKLVNIDMKKQRRFLRDLREFVTEYPDMEFRDYKKKDIHDRYVIASNGVAILGNSIKDFGNKESLVIVLRKKTNKDIIAALTTSFNKRWNQSGDIIH